MLRQRQDGAPGASVAPVISAKKLNMRPPPPGSRVTYVETLKAASSATVTADRKLDTLKFSVRKQLYFGRWGDRNVILDFKKRCVCVCRPGWLASQAPRAPPEMLAFAQVDEERETDRTRGIPGAKAVSVQTDCRG